MNLLTITAGGFTATVDGCARGENELWFLSMLGHQQAVRAIWARLVKGETAYLSETELGGAPVPLAREAWGTWRFSGARLPSGSAYHGMLVPGPRLIGRLLNARNGERPAAVASERPDARPGWPGRRETARATASCRAHRACRARRCR